MDDIKIKDNTIIEIDITEMLEMSDEVIIKILKGDLIIKKIVYKGDEKYDE